MLGTFLVACDFKTSQAFFEEDEIVVSVGDRITLDKYLSTKNVEKSQLTYKFEDSSLFDVEGRELVATKSGRSYVHAMLKNNILCSMQIVVKSNFAAPTFSNSPLSSDGVFSWNSVLSYYDGVKVQATSYRVEGTKKVYSTTDVAAEPVVTPIEKTVDTNSLSLDQDGLGYGVYTLTVTALGTGYFDNSAKSQEVTLYYGYVEGASDFALNSDGVLTWDGADNAQFAVMLDGAEMGQRQSAKSFDLSDRLSIASAGEHKVKIVSYDTNGKLFASESEEISITKFASPNAVYSYDAENGGRIEIETVAGVDKYQLEFTDASGKVTTLTLDSDAEKISSTFDALDAGLYSVKVQALTNGGFYFQSDVAELDKKIYKLPTARISGAGDNVIGGTDFAVSLSSATLPVDVLLSVSVDGLDFADTIDGFKSGENTFDFSLTLSEAKTYSMSLKQIAAAKTNEIEGESIYVINSNASNSLSATKVSAFDGEITHAYSGSNSVLSFAKVPNATNYALQVWSGDAYVDVDVSKYTLPTNEDMANLDTITITLAGKIESLFDTVEVEGKNIYKLRVVAKTADDSLAINSAKEKQIESLSAPEADDERATTSKTYSWNAVDGAESYRVELYKIDKTTYQNNQSTISIDTTALENIGKNTTDSVISLDDVGYYYAKVYSISSSANSHISSTDALEEVFYVSEQLARPSVGFGEKDSNYFLSIANVDNAMSYDIYLNDLKIGSTSATDSEATEFLIANNFENSGTEYKIGVVATSSDSTIYTESATLEFVVERLASVVRGDITISDLSLEAETSDLSTKSVSQKVSVSAIDGAKGVKIWNGDSTLTAGGETEKAATLEIGDKSNVELSFQFYGSEQDDNTKIFVMDGGKIYLNGAQSTFTFTRLQTPTNLAYYNGKLQFEHASLASTSYYVLTIVCVGLNNVAQTITVKLDTAVTATVDGKTAPLGAKIDYVSTSDNVVSIDFEKAIETILKVDEIAAVYNQSSKIGFAVFGYQDRQNSSTITLCSGFATTDLDSTKTICVVKKLDAATLSIDTTSDYVLSWDAVITNTSYESGTKYQVMLDGEASGSEISATTKSYAASDFDLSTYYEFSVVAKNPYYLQSSESNTVKIWKLSPISKIKLGEDGYLTYEIGSTEKDFVDYVGVQSKEIYEKNKNGKIRIVSTDEYYDLQVVGKTIASGQDKVVYLSSATSRWTITDMSTLKPNSENVTYSNNTITWSAFGGSENLQALRYILMFKDENDNTAVYRTKNTSENLTDNEDLFETISSLSGEIEIYVSAKLESYEIAVGNTIYYALGTKMPFGDDENNQYVYAGKATITKFATPTITNVEFVSDSLEDAQLPTVKVTFTGNYGETGSFNIYLGDEIWTSKDITKANGAYSFEIEPDDYNSLFGAGDTLKIGVSAYSSTNIPSSVGSVNILRAEEIESVEFVAETAGNLTHKIKIEFSSSEHISGGVVLKFVYTDGKTDEEKTEWISIPVSEVVEEIEYDLSEIINKKAESTNLLANGGTIKLSAFVNSFSSTASTNKVFYMACPTSTDSEEYDILAMAADITKTSGGFVIDGSENSSDTTYVVQCNGTNFDVEYDGEKFYFEFPHNAQWENGTYTLNIYAKQEDYLPSATLQVEFTLNRIGEITSVTLSRSETDLSVVTLTWNAVSGATGYVFRMYDGQGEKLLYEYIEERENGSSVVNSCTLSDMFGDGYQKLLDAKTVTERDLMLGKDVVFEVFVQGSEGINDSYVFTFNATIKGNDFEISNLEVDGFGNLILNCTEGETYIYRFVASDGTVLQNWTKLVATTDYEKIDTSKITADGGTKFNIEIIAVGKVEEEPISAKLDGLVLDSKVFTSKDSGTTYVVGTDIVEVGYIPTNSEQEISFELVLGTFTNLYVGLNETDLKNERAIMIEPTALGAGSNNLQEVYTYKLSELVDVLRDGGFEISTNGDITVYFWAYKSIENNDGNLDSENSYIISHSKSYTFMITDQVDFVEITKIGESTDQTKFMEDYANSFAIFENNDTESSTTLGIYVKISAATVDEESDAEVEAQANDEESSATSALLFVSKTDLLSEDYFPDNFAINLTKLFENSELSDLSGKFKFEFATLSYIVIDSDTNKLVLSDWLSAAGDKQFVFERLKQVEALALVSGNLNWTDKEENTQKYYVYFAEEINKDFSLGDNYSFDVSTVKTYDASAYVGTGNQYYLAVQSINEDPYVISSKLVYVTSSGSPVAVEKNQITSPLQLEDGKIFFELAEGQDFVDYIRECAEATDAVTELMRKTFYAPFTFTISDLVEGRIYVRLRFTSTASGVAGRAQTFDIKASSLISSLFDVDGFDYEAKFTKLISLGGLNTTIQTLTAFSKLMTSGSGGIGNSKALFDDYFELLQTGEYKLDYCLLGNSTTLTSAWYSYKNADGANSIYVNPETKVSAAKTADTTYSAINYYTVLLKKSDVYSSASMKELSEDYVVKIYNTTNTEYVFAITKGVGAYSLSMVGSDCDQTVTVYETNSSGEVVEGGEYLKFFINQNDENSILGRYADEMDTGIYKMQIYAVGNDYSLSSKSSVFNITFYDFGSDFKLNNGEFSWTIQRNMKPTVVYKKNSSAGEDVASVETTSTTARFCFEGSDFGSGLYDYVEFVIMGSVSGNNIYIDSDIYRVENVYKLAAPTLKNTNGLIQIDDTTNATLNEQVDKYYSDAGLYQYQVYNDVSSSKQFFTFTDDNNAESAIYYAPGTTDIIQETTDDYKKTEVDASEFFVSSIGSTATFQFDDDILSVGDGEDAKSFNIKKVSCLDSLTGEIVEVESVGVAVRSNYSSIKAKMMDEVGSLTIDDGVLTWNKVTGRKEDNLTIPSSAQVVYKVTVVQYDTSASSSGDVDNVYADRFEYYTTETQFDFARIPEESLNKEAKYMKAFVQAFAAIVSTTAPTYEQYITLVEGGYAYGNVKYANSEFYVLMSDGATIRQIERSSTIDEDSLEVIDGKLYWSFTVETESEIEDLSKNYMFTVVDEDFNEITGETSIVSTSGKTVTIMFSEDKGQISAKTQTLSVYATRLNTSNSVIKSFAKEIIVTKLKAIDTDDYTINSDISDSRVETLDFAEYFKDNASNVITLSIYENSEKTGDPTVFTFTATDNVLYILSENADVDSSQKYVVGQTSKPVMVFSVKNASLENCLYADVSEDIILQRSSWGSSDAIVWNDESQRFEWTYGGYSALSAPTAATQIKQVIMTNKDATLYQDIEGEAEAEGLTVEEGTDITIEDVYDKTSKIIYLGNAYYIRNSDYESGEKLVSEKTLQTGTLYKVVEEISSEEILIMLEGGDEYRISSEGITLPVYIVEATYGEGRTQVVRTYTTTENHFTPTIIGKVAITVKIKLGQSNIQSQALVYDGDEVTFNLFESGQGTIASPYKIATEAQLRNLAYRLEKESYLTSYTENGNSMAEEAKYYFEITNDITLTEALNGILFDGTFTGVINGKDYTLTYTNSTVSALTSGAVSITDGCVTGTSSIGYGAALFEKLSSSAVVKDLNLNVKLDVSLSTQSYIGQNSLIAGLVITNSGRIENVNLVGFSSNFAAPEINSRAMTMVYSGIASVNTGASATITNCAMDTDITIDDSGNSQLIFVSGIVFTNYATVSDCTAGTAENARSISVIGKTYTDIVQVAGIVTTNGSSATLQNCTNYANLSVSAQDRNDYFVVYLAGIANLGNGRLSDNTNSGTLVANNILESNLTKGDIYSKQEY
jgi:hypothetical protein